MTIAGEALRPRRADARRNYDTLLRVAVQCFTTRGVDVSLEEIAAAAGVGIGTLYRNFPSREALVVAAYRQGVEQLCESAQLLLAQHPADVALQMWMQSFIDYVATKRGLTGILKAAADDHDDLFAYVRKSILDAMAGLLSPAVASGMIRADIGPEDLIRAMGGICFVTDQPGWQEQASRLLSLLMDGLRYRAPLPSA